MSKALLEYHNKKLCFGIDQKPLADLCQNYLGPFYVYDLSFIQERFQQMKNSLDSAEIYYAMKANSNPMVLKRLKKIGSKVDVVSQGEIERALNNDFLPKDIVFSGVGKTEKEIHFALEKSIHQINVESFSELKRVSAIAVSLRVKAPIALRLNPNIDIKTHPYIATGLYENKFGIEITILPEIIAFLNANTSSLELKGISLHLGSQMLEFSGFAEALRLLRPVYIELQNQFPTMNRFDIGGGLGIHYEKMNLDEELQLLNEYTNVVKTELKGLKALIQTEPGRWLVAHAGVLIGQIQYIKPSSQKTFLILDTGMNHLIRPALYQAYHQIMPLLKNDKLKVYDVVGPICESSDFFAKDRTLSECSEGDFIAIADCGAYGYSMSNTYNLQELPKEIMI